MSENLKMLWSFAMMLGLFAYFMQRGAKDLARLAGWLRSKAVAYAYELLNLHCEVCRLRRLQQWRRWFNRHPGIRSSRNITMLLLMMLIAIPAFATNFYVRDGASGSSCADWSTNACDQMPAMGSIARGDTIYFAGGTYNQLSLSKANSGSTVITIKAATVASHGTSTGWNDSYATQATFAGAQFLTDYWTIDGVSRNESDWTSKSAYGFASSDRLFSSAYDPSNGTHCAAHITIQYVDIGGADVGNTFDNANPDGVYMLGDATSNSCDSWLISHNRLHNVKLGTMLDFATNVTIEYNYYGPSWAKEAIRGKDYSKGHIIRYNRFVDSCQFNPTDGTSVCDGEIGIWDSVVSGGHDNIKVYGNYILTTTSTETHTGGTIFIGGGSAIIGLSGVSASGTEIYNNTIAGQKSSTRGSSQYGLLINGGDSTGSGNSIQNNLFYDVAGTWTAAGGGGTNTNNTVAGADPFVSYAGGNLHLSANTATGTTLSSPYDNDMDGVTRGGPAAWSLGAFQFTSGGGGGSSGSPLYIATMAIFLLMIFLWPHDPPPSEQSKEPERQSVLWR